MSNEIYEHIIYFGGPIVAAKLAMTSRYMKATFHVTMREKITTPAGTVIIMNDPRWGRYWEIPDYIIYLMHDSSYYKTHLTIISRQTGSMLKAILAAELGRHKTESGNVICEVRGNGLLEYPSTTQYRFDFTLDNKIVKIRILHNSINHRIMSVLLHD